MEWLMSGQEAYYLIYILLALGVLLAFSSLAHALSRRESSHEAKSRRLKMISEGNSVESVLALLKPNQKQGLFSRLPLIGDLPRTLTQAGVRLSPERFIMLCLGAFVLILLFGLRFTDPLRAGITAFGLAFFLPLVMVRQRQQEQVDKLVHQLPDALDLMARGLRVGHPLNTSIGSVAREMPDPIGTEFGIVFDQVNFGDDLTDAMQELAERVDIEDVHYLSASIGIQHGTGGDLASVVQTLSNVIRGRIAMRRKIKAISAEGRLSAWFLSCLPIIIYGYTSFMTPDYYGGVSDDPLFLPMAAAVVAFTVLNFLVLRKLVRFRI